MINKAEILSEGMPSKRGLGGNVVMESNVKLVQNKKPRTLREDIAVLALGQAGGNIGKVFQENGFNTLFINTSHFDLDTLDVSQLCKYHIKNGEGSAKDREKAKELLKDDLSGVMSNINFRIKEKIILVASSTSGGSGSGIAPYIINELLKQNQSDLEIGKTAEKLIICPVAIVPYKYECFQSKVNATQYFYELETIKGVGTSFIIDNNVSDDKFALNNAFYNSFLNLVTIPDFVSTKSNFDESELKRMLSSNGTTLISTMDTINNIDFASIYVDIKDNSIYPLNNDGKIKFMAVSLPEGSGGLTFKSVFDGLKKEFGNPVSAFEDVNNSNKIIITLSGLSFPYELLDMFKEDVDNMKEDVKKNFKKESRVEKLTLDFLDDVDDGNNLFSNYFD